MLKALDLDARKALDAACDKFEIYVDVTELLSDTEYHESPAVRLTSPSLYHSKGTAEDTGFDGTKDNGRQDLVENTEAEILEAFTNPIADAKSENMSERRCKALVALLQEFRDIFAYVLGRTRRQILKQCD